MIVEIRPCNALSEFDIFDGVPPKLLVPTPLPFPTAVFVLAGVGGVAKWQQSPEAWKSPRA